MVKSIIHLADYHCRTYKMHEEYIEVNEKFYVKANELFKGLEYKERRIAIVGDIFHQKITVSNEQVILIANFLTKCAEIAPLIVVAGNHDAILTNKDRMDSITPVIELLNNKNITYYKQSGCYLDDNIIWCNYSVFEDDKRPDIESCRKLYGTDKKFIGLYHAPIQGCKTDMGFSVNHGATLEHFDGLDCAMLGDIHLRQEFRYKNIPIVYPSSFLQQNFGERINGHGFLLWDVETLTYTEHDIPTDYGFYQFKINSVDDLEENKDILLNA